MLARARAAIGDVAGARGALAELAAVTEAVDSEPLRAALAFAAGVVDAQGGQLESARTLLEDAVDRRAERARVGGARPGGRGVERRVSDLPCKLTV